VPLEIDSVIRTGAIYTHVLNEMLIADTDGSMGLPSPENTFELTMIPEHIASLECRYSK